MTLLEFIEAVLRAGGKLLPKQIWQAVVRQYEAAGETVPNNIAAKVRRELSGHCPEGTGREFKRRGCDHRFDRHDDGMWSLRAI